MNFDIVDMLEALSGKGKLHQYAEIFAHKTYNEQLEIVKNRALSLGISDATWDKPRPRFLNITCEETKDGGKCWFYNNGTRQGLFICGFTETKFDFVRDPEFDATAKYEVFYECPEELVIP